MEFKSIWRYRYFILSSVRTEFRARFARSWLGGLWMILHPLAQVAIYAFVLSLVLGAKLPGLENRYAYAIYLMAGMLGWSLFAEVLGRSLNVFIENGNLLKKMAFPRIALPLVVMGSSLVNNVLLLMAILVVFGALGHAPMLAMVWLPVLTVVTLGMAAGMGLALGIVNVFIRDLGQVVPIVLQFWFWLTPVVYVFGAIPETYRPWFQLNPMTGIVLGYQEILVYGRSPDLMALTCPSLLAVVTLGLALFLYRRAGEEMVDAL